MSGLSESVDYATSLYTQKFHLGQKVTIDAQVNTYTAFGSPRWMCPVISVPEQFELQLSKRTTPPFDKLSDNLIISL